MNHKRQIVALLPMKAHSERVKGKNFLHLNSKPLFRWILDTLLSLEEISKVIINTDARDILVKNGLRDTNRVQIRDRKPELHGDMVSMNRVLADDIATVPADIYLMTHVTNPFLSADTIRGAIAHFEERRANSGADSLFTVNRFQTRFYRADASPVNHDPKNLLRTQDLEPWFEENSCLYIFTADSFAATNARIGNRPVIYEIPKLEALDIDTMKDWEHAVLLTTAGYPHKKTVA